MKKQALVIAGLAVLSTNAFASKARVQALGQNTLRGSEYISDTRNVFRNPSALNDTKNYIITEWGSGAESDASDKPRAEGGFFREAGALSYGVYLGNDGEMNSFKVAGTSYTRKQGNVAATANDSDFLSQDNAADVFLAGDMGVKWGARFHFAHSKDETSPGGFERKNTAFGVGLGASMGAAEAYANVDIKDKSTSANAAADEFKLKPSYLVGGSYVVGDYTVFASYEQTKADVKLAAGGGIVTAINTRIKATDIRVGAGRTMEINPTARVFTDLQVSIANDTNQTATGKTKFKSVPLTLGLEADATSWLVVRGSVSQNLWDETKSPAGKKKTEANTTAVAAGATLNFGKLKVDGLVGTTAGTRGSGTVGSNTNEGVLATDNLMTRVGVHYWF